jgi:hypothetical protein
LIANLDVAKMPQIQSFVDWLENRFPADDALPPSPTGSAALTDATARSAIPAAR